MDFINSYKYIHFLVKRASLLVTKIYIHYTLEQSKLKKRFRNNEPNITLKIKQFRGKVFYKLMNNSNFGYDSRNNIDNGTFAPISNELDEILYLKIIPKSF